MENILFPHEEIRNQQSGFMKDFQESLHKKNNFIAHAPTGLGKTAATLSVALPYALENDLTVYFLTNRHTQHKIAIETLQEIHKKHDQDFIVTDLIGKQSMCLQDNVENLYNNEFMEFCRNARDNNTCSYYTNLYKKGGSQSKLTSKAKKAKHKVARKGAMHVNEIKEEGENYEICPYYLTTELAKDAEVVVSDYYTLFNPVVRQSFFMRTDQDLEDSIIIVDEGHNLPDRLRNLLSTKLSSFMLDQAKKEADKYDYDDLRRYLNSIEQILGNLADFEQGSQGLGDEKRIRKNQFMHRVKQQTIDYDDLYDELDIAGEKIRDKQKRSFVGSVAEFLQEWKEGENKGYLRYIKDRSDNQNTKIELRYTCLDSSTLSGDIFDKCEASVIMSGTLTPTSMYKDILGVSDATEKEYESPFPEENRLSLIVPKTTTKYKERGEEMYKKIGGTCIEIMNQVPGNTAFFFPSYYIRDEILKVVKNNTDNTVLAEQRSFNTEEKEQFLEEFKEHKKGEGAALFGVTSGNFSEGIDLPDDNLKAVVVVGLPLSKPDLQTKGLINYYDEKFNKGWDYGYVYPAITRCLQAAGRCIRSKEDKGAVILLDKRFTSSQYYRCLPPDFKGNVSRDYVDELSEFFNN